MSMQIQGGDEAESSGGFKFEEVDFQPATLKDLNFKNLWAKWGLDQCSYMKKFTFDEFFSKHQLDVFLKDFFASPQVQSSLKVASGRASWAPIGPISKASTMELKCTVTNMEFFERLKEMDPPVLRENGNIMKCFDEMVEGLMISDELRKILIMEDSENYEEISPEERSEFIFHLFSRIQVGGGTCQYEDEIQPYLDVTKGLYKDLMTVRKQPATKRLEVTSLAYQLLAVDADSFALFPDTASERFCTCYLIIEPLDRHVTVWYQAHVPPF